MEDGSDPPRITKHLQALIPNSKIMVRLGKWTGLGTESQCYPLFVGKKKLTCVGGAADGVNVTVHLSPDNMAVAINVSQYGEASAMGGYDLVALPLDGPTLADLLNLKLAHDVVVGHADALVRAGSSPMEVAKELNARGFRLYKKKDYKAAGQAFEAAHKIESSYELPVLNRAGVAGLDGDAATCVKWLKILKEIGTPKAKKLLTVQVTKDHDFDKVRNAAEFKAFMASVR